MRLAAQFLFLGSLVAVALPARADGTQCAQAFEQAQRLRKASKLLDARAALVSCAQAQCPAFIRKDCSEWLPEVEHETPSIAIRVLDGNGCDRPDVVVFFDGNEVPGAGGGSSVDVDPGTHEVAVELDGAKLTRTVVVVRGERNRSVTLTAGSSTTCAPASSSPPAPFVAPSPIDPPKKRRPVPTIAYVLGGVGLAGIGVGGAFSGLGWSQRGDLDDCRGRCSNADVTSAQRAFLIGDVGLAVGIVALAAGTIVYLLR